MNIEQIKQQLTNNKTPFVELEPCSQCGGTVYYYRKGRRHNGCVMCRMNKLNSATAKGNSLPQEAAMIDGNGVRLYEAKRCCKDCGGRTRLSENAYGAKAGRCHACAIHQQQEREQGKQIKRLTTTTNEHAHKFVVDSVHRSQCIEVAPSSYMEWLELKDLILRCRLMNEHEKASDTGIHWEVCHVYPAMPDGEPYRGKATVENLVIAQYETNRKAGNKVPDSWTLKQVVSVADVRLIQTSYEAAKEWKGRKEKWSQMTEAERKEWKAQSLKLEAQHRELVKEITRGFCDSLPLIENMQLMELETALQKAELSWLKVQNKMTSQINAALKSGRKVDYVEAREQRITLDAFHGAEARIWITYQTLQQIADAELILTERGMTDEQREQLALVKRCAVLWAIDVNQNPKQLVMGFTHPLLNVLGDAWTWGTRPDEHGNQWVCVWEPLTLQSKADQRTPFDEVEAMPDDANQVWLTETPYPVKDVSKDGWQSTDAIYLYEQERKKRARKAREEREALERAKQEAQRALLVEKISKRISLRIKSLTEGLSELYGYAGEMLREADQPAAQQLIADCYERAAQWEAELMDIQNAAAEPEKALNQWEVSTMRLVEMNKKGSHVFSDLLNPF
ncbi:TPA: hypothetical protein N2G37_004365 [Salmonella enterica]|nr:hypothetical protein [Salmonella enterica]